MEFKTAHLKVAALLTGRLFRIPEYQRAYAWGTRQRSDLFKDILEVKRSGREHFMATIVALARDSRLIGVDDYLTVEIVDGQQRITTLVILLKAIEKALCQQDARQQRVRCEIADFLLKDDDFALVLLQTNHDSSSVFVDYIRKGEIKHVQALTSADLNIIDAVRDCEEFVKSWSATDSLIDLVATIRNKLFVIYHEISDPATVYRVFEVLNSRGLDVKWIDKLKSQLMALLFEHVQEGTRSEAVREMQVLWQDIYRTLGLRDGLGDEALRFAGTWARSSEQSRVISQEEATTELCRAAGTKVQSITDVGSRLRAVVKAVSDLDSRRRLGAVTRIAHARFLAVAILLRHFTPDVEDRLLGKWERVTFRIFGIGRADARNKVGDYVRLGHQIFAKGATPDEIEARLVLLGENFSLDDVIRGPNNWSNCYEGWSEELRYLLFRYDEHLAASMGFRFNESQWNRVWADDASRSIEHIQPQSTKVSYLHSLGNLTMLLPGVNSSLQDKPPVEKANTYLTTGLLATIAVGRAIESGADWNEAAVCNRTLMIEKFIRKEWAD